MSGDSPPAEQLRDLDASLRGVQFKPRESLLPEVLGRLRRGERSKGAGSSPARRAALGAIAAGLVAVGAVAIHGISSLQAPKDSHTIDLCCQDLDGGGIADDGLVVLTDSREQVKRLSIYEDRDQSRAFSGGDTLRFLRNGGPAMLESPGAEMRTVQFCCRDYDGGGLDDDGLIVIGRPPDRIAMAAIYEGRPGAPNRYRLR